MLMMAYSKDLMSLVVVVVVVVEEKL